MHSGTKVEGERGREREGGRGRERGKTEWGETSAVLRHRGLEPVDVLSTIDFQCHKKQQRTPFQYL